MTDAPHHPPPTAIVIGAGLSGLIATKELLAAGWSVSVLEAAAHPGGQLRPTQQRTADGFLLERGFPLLFAPWPALERHLDLASLGIQPFESDVLIWTGTQRIPLNIRIGRKRSPLLSMADWVHLTQWAWEVRRADWRSAAEAACEPSVDRSALEALRARGFSDSFIDSIARPVLGGLMLDRTLATSEGMMNFILRSLVTENLVLPTNGVAAIPEALAAHLPAGTITTGVHVQALIHEGTRVVGVRTSVGDRYADAVIVATDPVTARTLTGIEAIPTAGIGATAVFLTAPEGPEIRALGSHLLFDGTGGERGINSINHLIPLSAVQPTAAPPGHALLAAIVLDAADRREEIAETARRDAMRLTGIPNLRVVGMEVVPFAGYAQPAGIHRVLPDAITGVPGLVLASDATVDSSPNGAILSGEAAARAAINATV